MKLLIPTSLFALALGLSACGNATHPAAKSAVKEAPDAINAYQKIGLSTKPYSAVRASAQIAATQKYWSGFYWPTYQGGVAQRWQTYQDTEDYTKFLYNVGALTDYQRLPPDQLIRLSPAEKYDLWLSDANMSLTRSELQKVVSTAQSFGNKVPTWFGICDGWSLAASMEDEPVRIVRGQSASGQLIDFYPEDIKALMAYYYATSPKQYVTAGGRCNREQVTKDADGRVIEPECRDINPATFHLALDRFVGDANQKLIMDIYRDEMVWNYPVYNYQFQYNNLRNVSDEPKYTHAAPGTQFLINVTAQVTLVAGVGPTTKLAPQRAYQQKTWSYVLELDSNYNILGGEWISDQHPDFVWIVQAVGNHYSRVDYDALAALAKASHP